MFLETHLYHIKINTDIFSYILKLSSYIECDNLNISLLVFLNHDSKPHAEFQK